MNLTGNINSIINLVISLLKSIFIFPGFSLYTAIGFLTWASVVGWVLNAIGVFRFGGGGGDE